MVHTLLLIVLILILFSLLGGYSGLVPPYYGYGGTGLGFVILIILLVLLFR